MLDVSYVRRSAHLLSIVRRSGPIHRDEMSDQVQRLRDHRAETGIILGSDLNSLVGDLAKQQMIPYAAFSEIPQPSVPGHAGRFVLGDVEKTKIIFAQGRVHLYEGYSAREVTSIVRVVAEAGICLGFQTR